jgi:membrane associated rhomboid family serine protease
MSRRRFSFSEMRITRGALWLLVAEVGVSLVFLLLNTDARLEMANWLVASDVSVWTEGKVWTLFTSPVLQPEPLSLIFHALILWMFVPTIERWWGTKRFLRFAAYTSLAGTVAGTAAAALLPGDGAIAGLSPFVFASIVAFGVLYSDRHVQFFGVLPMTGKQLMIGIVAFNALFVVLGRQWALGAAYAAAMALAWLLVSGKWTPKVWWLRRKQAKVRRKLKVMKGGADDPPKKWMN